MTSTSFYFPIKEANRKTWTILERRGSDLHLWSRGFRSQEAAQRTCDRLNADVARLAGTEQASMQ